MTFCTTWDVTDYQGEPITVGFVARALLESQDDGTERLICRAMNWRSVREGPAVPADYLAQRILNGLAQPGVHRALVDLNNWRLLKWLDDPAPFFDWRGPRGGSTRMCIPPMRATWPAMTMEFANGATSGVLRMRGPRWRMDADPRDRQPRRTRRGHRRRPGVAAAARPTKRSPPPTSTTSGMPPPRVLGKPSPAKPNPRSLSPRRLPDRRVRRRGPDRGPRQPTLPGLDGDDDVEFVHHACVSPRASPGRSSTPAAHAASAPVASCAAAASAARSAAACAR